MYEQSNTRQGLLPIQSGADLSAANGHLVKAANSGGNIVVVPIAAADDPAHYLVVNGAASGVASDVLPLAHGQQVRIPIVGSCVPGDSIAHADPATAPGKVRKLPAAAGTYTVIGYAEESAVDGQFARIRITTPTPTVVAG